MYFGRTRTIRILSVLLAVILFVSSIPFLSVGTVAYSKGDLNGDGKINATDSNLIKKIIIGAISSNPEMILGDTDGDGKVNVADFNLIKRVILGMYTIPDNEYKVGTVTLGGTDISNYSIKIPSEYPFGTYRENAEYAAEVLRDHIAKACGITLGISENATEHDITFVYDADTYGTEAFNISIGEGSVTITCGTKRGPLYGAFGFLEEIMGYRFYGQNTEYLYENKSIVKEAGYSHTEGLNTPFKYRHTYTRLYMNGKYLGAYDGDYPDSYTAAHVTGGWDGMQNTMWTPKYGYGYGPDRNHSVFSLMPEQCKKDPDVISGLYDWTIAKVCYSVDESLDECVTNLRAHLKSLEARGFVDGDNMPMISISNNDSFTWCQCRLCNKLINRHKEKSATLIDFIRRVSEALEPEYPNLQFWTLAYYCTAKAPVGLDIPDNLYICYCYYPACSNHHVNGTECTKFSGGIHNGWNEENIRSWLAVTDKVHVWYYTSQFAHSVTGDPIIKRIFEDIKYFKEIGVKGIFGQASNDSLGWDDLVAYLMSELMWNPDMTWEEYDGICREFCQFNYGPGWKNLYDYFMLMEEASDRSGCWCCLGDSPEYVYDYSYLRENITAVAASLEEALAMAENDDQYTKIERITMQMYFVFLTASYDEMYVNGNEASRGEYERMFTLMYNRFVKHKATVKFSDMIATNDASIPDTCDPTVSPMSWYKDQSVRMNNRWW